MPTSSTILGSTMKMIIHGWKNSRDQNDDNHCFDQEDNQWVAC
jgi:hypothetical protein